MSHPVKRIYKRTHVGSVALMLSKENRDRRKFGDRFQPRDTKNAVSQW